MDPPSKPESSATDALASADDVSIARANTVDDWALAYIETTSLRTKCSPPPAPLAWREEPRALDARPGRPPELRVTMESPKSAKLGALVRSEARAQLTHKFWHHELQAAELMAWAILRFCDTPLAFRRGLLRIMQDEIRHMALYQSYLEDTGFALGAFPVRDWFWERVPTVTDPLGFVALLGMGLEAANLEHTLRFADWFRTVGDERGASIQDQIGREEVAHVGFATRWFAHFSGGGVDFDIFRAALPPPLSPLLLRGKTIARERRLRSGMPIEFIEALANYRP